MRHKIERIASADFGPRRTPGSIVRKNAIRDRAIDRASGAGTLSAPRNCARRS
jgi:hypothetical protein